LYISSLFYGATVMAKSVQYLVIFSFCWSVSCRQATEEFPNNKAATYNNVSTVKVENYINRLYIDLLGREPLDNETNRDLGTLRAGSLSYGVRADLITRLMTDSVYVPGDSSYRRAYYQRMYDLAKARLLEGASEDEFHQQIGNAQFALLSSRLNGDSIGVYASLATIDRCKKVLSSRREYQFGKITIGEMYSCMLNNPIYDVINMNTLNFVNASFDDLFYRFPTRDEFKIAYDIIEAGKGASMFGGFADNKPAYCKMLVNSGEYHEGMIKWCYLTLLGREPNTQETYNLMEDFYKTKNLQEVQKTILMTDEYAHF
jgi:hypothetical protein